jgi:hypothetical protein
MKLPGRLHCLVNPLLHFFLAANPTWVKDDLAASLSCGVSHNVAEVIDSDLDNI